MKWEKKEQEEGGKLGNRVVSGDRRNFSPLRRSLEISSTIGFEKEGYGSYWRTWIMVGIINVYGNLYDTLHIYMPLVFSAFVKLFSY